MKMTPNKPTCLFVKHLSADPLIVFQLLNEISDTIKKIIFSGLMVEPSMISLVKVHIAKRRSTYWSNSQPREQILVLISHNQLYSK